MAEKRKMETTEQIRAAEQNLSRLLDWVMRFDNKTAILLGTLAAMLALLASFAPPFRLWTPLAVVFVAFTLALITVCLIIVSWGSIPQTKGPDSLLYFGTITNLSRPDYAKSFHAQTLDDYLEDLLSQCHRNSEIISTKFRRLRWAYGILVPTFVPWIVTLLVFRSLQ